MTEITLFCLVNGDNPKNAFPVHFEDSKLVGDLKDAIKKKRSPRFDDIAADELDLWKVDASPTEAQKIKLKEGKELSPFKTVQHYWPEGPSEGECIHIIIARPSGK